MSALAISLLVFVAAIGGALGGMLLRAKLPREHLSDASQSVVQHGIALVATMAALVLGLLIASGNSSYNSARAQISQLTARKAFFVAIHQLLDLTIGCCEVMEEIMDVSIVI